MVTKVTAGQYVDLVNAQMVYHRQFKSGMAVRLEMAKGHPIGIQPTTVMPGLDAIAAWAEFEVTQQYEVDPPFADWRQLP